MDTIIKSLLYINSERNMIIHYCWFGPEQKPDLVLTCLNSWKKYCPEAKFIEWNEQNFDINCCKYVKEAYLHKKWAFVSDYCRYYVLFRFGGIYLDTDVEIIKELKDLPETFVGFESGAKQVASGLIRGAKIEDEICKLMLDSYQNDSFVLENGSLNTKTVCERETEILVEAGLQLENRLQNIHGTVVYPVEYFCPYNFATGELHISPKTYSIHHYASSWLSPLQRETLSVTQKLSRYFPQKTAYYISLVLVSLRYDGVRMTGEKTMKYLKKLLTMRNNL